MGMDFGGFGGKMEYMFLDYGGLFFGAGHNLLGLGMNGGVILKALPKKQVTPYFLGMYGYTGVIKIKNADNFDKIDYGYSIGTGIEIKTRHLNAWQIGVVLPFRSQEFKDHYQSLKGSPNIDLNAELFPIALSLGFKIVM